MIDEADPGRWRWQAVGDAGYAVAEAGCGLPLEVRLADGQMWSLPAWRYPDHLNALRISLIANATGIDLDLSHYLAPMFDAAAIPPALRAELAPLALWWACGGSRASGTAAASRLRPWSERERQAAMAACLVDDATDSASARFDAVGYLDRMLRASVDASPTGFDLDGLTMAAVLPLLDAVVALNVVDPMQDPLPSASPRARAAASQTLSLCKALGWTPSQVWAAPAAEVDRLLALLAAAGGAGVSPPVAARKRSLIDHPDAVQIRIDD